MRNTLATPIVVFDIDGTLTDTVALHQRAFEAALRSFDFPRLRTQWGSYRHHSDSAIFREAWEEAGFDGEPPLQLLEARYQREYDALCDTDASEARACEEIAGASQLLAQIAQAGWIAAFATGSLRHGAHRKMALLTHAVDAELLATASEHETREDIVQAAIDKARARHGVPAGGRVVSIGDGVWDLLTARALGLEFVGIGDADRAKQLAQIDADVVVRGDLRDVGRLLGCYDPDAGA
jgi:phosphoglycolate phosphatase-like HAD superfamily hydrolase